MTMSIDEAQNCVNWLCGAISLHLSKASFLGKHPKVLLVEGSTDKQFISTYLMDETICQLSSSYQGFRQPRTIVNSKDTIVSIVNSLFRFKALLKIPVGMANTSVMGMIDRDFDEDLDPPNGNLFITDTHDLETLILSTDQSVLERLAGCTVSTDDVKKAVFMAYQIGRMIIFLRSALNIRKAKISHGSSSVNYADIFDGDGRISLVEVLRIEKDEHNPNSQKFKKLIEKLARDKSIRSYLGPDYCWKIGLDEFDFSRYADLWAVMNGHDVMELLKYLNADVAMKYETHNNGFGGCSLDRRLEMDVINAYDRRRFARTKLCERMSAAGVLKAFSNNRSQG